MGDIVVAIGKPKEGGTSIQCPMLSTSNYTVWAVRMRMALKVHKAWEVVETETLDTEKNNLAMALLFQSIPESLVLQVAEFETAKQVWEAIKTRHVGAERVREARLQTLISEFDRLRMKETKSIDDFGGKLSELAYKSAALGTTIEEAKIVKKLLSSLPRKKYIQIVASLEQVLDLNKTSFEDIFGRLKAYEERIQDETSEEDDKGKLLYTNSEGQARQAAKPQGDYSSQWGNRDHNESYRGRGRGGRSYRGRGRGR